MSALPSPRTKGRQKASRKQSLSIIAQLLEEQMNEMGLLEAEKNTRTDALVERVKKVTTSRAAVPSK